MPPRTIKDVTLTKKTDLPTLAISGSCFDPSPSSDRVGIEGGKEAILDAFDHTNTFIFVRHPFVRFVSAYRSKKTTVSFP